MSRPCDSPRMAPGSTATRIEDGLERLGDPDSSQTLSVGALSEIPRLCLVDFVLVLGARRQEHIELGGGI